MNALELLEGRERGGCTGAQCTSVGRKRSEGVRSRPFSFHLFHFWFLLCPRALEAAFPLGIRGGSGTGGYARSSAGMACARGVGRGACTEDAGRPAQRVWGYLWLRTPHVALATAVQLQCLGHVPIFVACGAQVVMHACPCYFMSFWGEVGRGAGGYDGAQSWHSVAAASESSACSFAICARAAWGRRESERGRCACVGAAEIGAALRMVGCGFVCSRRSGSAAEGGCLVPQGVSFAWRCLCLCGHFPYLFSLFFRDWLFCVHTYPE
ncbi:hypothetical protein B0H13DRAFT_881268 [Mycena leptocephala]|nr:hypothetical protein B0H13DRAFT_881268 [Mycena leptocephala]